MEANLRFVLHLDATNSFNLTIINKSLLIKPVLQPATVLSNNTKATQMPESIEQGYSTRGPRSLTEQSQTSNKFKKKS